MKYRGSKDKPAKSYTESFQQQGNDFAEINMQVIGIVHSPYKERFDTPRQPALTEHDKAQSCEGSIILNPGFNFEQALKDLDTFSHIWVLYWMHLNRGWNPTVIPPRGPKIRRGLFATRAPHRPNSIGISVVTLKSIHNRTLTIENPDMLDGTPVLDIKPYLPYADAFPNASHGWLEEAGREPLPSTSNRTDG
ncbi:MAG: tRNA (N6-threonylcarbamoyladenosine(37)-N6)-methyltransferase TrmO [Zetaproteobacteria bacterium]|nr:tRNA (N6-threonylcarbamoyladenosine(37)-N6)-methyltransferase TrmO [Zetaproteobacteria bacterium]